MGLIADRVLDTSTSTGTGVFTLSGTPPASYRAWSAGHIVGELVSYEILAVDGSGNPTGEWEIGFGTLTTATTITRLVAILSSNANALVNFSAGTKQVFSNASAFLLGDEFAHASPTTWVPSGGFVTVPGAYGLPAQTALGTATARTFVTTNRLTRAARMGYVSAATAAAFAGNHTTNANRAIGNGSAGGFMCIERFGCSDAATVAGARQFVGLRNIVTTPTNVEPNTLTNHIGVAVLSTGSNLQLVSGGTTANAAIDLGANFPGNSLSTDLYELTLFSPRGVANTVLWNLERVGSGFSASGLFANATPGTTMPASTLFLGRSAWRTNNATLLAVGLDVGAAINYGDY
jgi:hypothetical protein